MHACMASALKCRYKYPVHAFLSRNAQREIEVGIIHPCHTLPYDYCTLLVVLYCEMKLLISVRTEKLSFISHASEGSPSCTAL